MAHSSITSGIPSVWQGNNQIGLHRRCSRSYHRLWWLWRHRSRCRGHWRGGSRTRQHVLLHVSSSPLIARQMSDRTLQQNATHVVYLFPFQTATCNKLGRTKILAVPTAGQSIGGAAPVGPICPVTTQGLHAAPLIPHRINRLWIGRGELPCRFMNCPLYFCYLSHEADAIIDWSLVRGLKRQVRHKTLLGQLYVQSAASRCLPWTSL